MWINPNLGMMDESTDDEIRQLRKRLRIEKEEQDDLKVVIQVRNQALENLQEVVDEKTRESSQLERFCRKNFQRVWKTTRPSRRRTKRRLQQWKIR